MKLKGRDMHLELQQMLNHLLQKRIGRDLLKVICSDTDVHLCYKLVIAGWVEPMKPCSQATEAQLVQVCIGSSASVSRRVPILPF